MKRALLATALLSVLAVAAWGGYRHFATQSTAPAFRFAAVERGPLTAVVASSGTLQPVTQVQVGSQVSGQVREIFVDFNDAVREGQLIARIDPENFQHRVRQAEADLEAARAMVAVQQAEALRARVNLDDAERDYARKERLVGQSFLSPAELDKARTVLDAARAQLEIVRAQARNSEALVRQRAAQLAQAKVDLARTEIRSPVDGLVVKRSVDRGQTVAASLQAPELFVIARNLSDMQVETAIDEADVGRIRVGQKASFSVDAFPGRRFQGEVKQVRKAAHVASNVVSYTVIVSAANAELLLLPGMTANVRIITAEKESVLKVPNAALRFRPPVEGQKPGATAGSGGGGGRGGGRGAAAQQNVYILAEGKPQAVAVKTGLSDSQFTEIVEGALQEGQQVIVGMAPAGGKSAPPPAAPGLRML